MTLPPTLRNYDLVKFSLTTTNNEDGTLEAYEADIFSAVLRLTNEIFPHVVYVDRWSAAGVIAPRGEE